MICAPMLGMPDRWSPSHLPFLAGLPRGTRVTGAFIDTCGG